MFFIFNDIIYIIARKRLLIVKIENIIDIIKNTLNLIKINIKKTQIRIKIQIDNHRIEINYQIKDNIYLFIKHIVIDKSSHKLKNNMIDFYFIVKKINVVYKLKLSKILRIHSVQNSKYLRKNFDDFLSK